MDCGYPFPIGVVPSGMHRCTCTYAFFLWFCNLIFCRSLKLLFFCIIHYYFSFSINLFFISFSVIHVRYFDFRWHRSRNESLEQSVSWSSINDIQQNNYFTWSTLIIHSILLISLVLTLFTLILDQSMQIVNHSHNIFQL